MGGWMLLKTESVLLKLFSSLRLILLELGYWSSGFKVAAGRCRV